MSKSLKVLLLSVFFSFLWGLWWSLRDYMPPIIQSETRLLKVLSVHGIFSPQLIQMAEDNKFLLKINTKTNSYDLLREILSPQTTYDLVIFPSTIGDSIVPSNYFQQAFSEQMYDELSISIDFRSLDFDSENKYTIPLLWGVYAWTFKGEVQGFSLAKEVESGQAKHLYVYPRPASVYSVMQKLYPQSHSFVQTNNREELKAIFTTLSQKIRLRTASLPSDISEQDLIQIKHTEKEAMTTLGLKVSLPIEKADLDVIIAAVGKDSQVKKDVHEFIKLLFRKSSVEEMTVSSGFATVKVSDTLSLPEVFKAEAIRTLPISRIQLISHHEAYEPLFTEFLRKSFPKVLDDETKKGNFAE